ncbi:MAG TPA: DinB family protein [Pyrinomonadaceae bacterium]|nr:DinB family protein [Pyrinomonadaceae bacterium]
MTTAKPAKTEYAPYYEKYVSLVTEEDVVAVLSQQSREVSDLFASIDEARGTYAYAEGKWTIKELFIHLLDSERVFAYRALRIARGDKTPMEGFEQDDYIETSHANERTLANLIEEFEAIRRSNVILFSTFDQQDWQRAGTASNAEVSTRALASIMAGHVRHHIAILKDRYL